MFAANTAGMIGNATITMMATIITRAIVTNSEGRD